MRPYVLGVPTIKLFQFNNKYRFSNNTENELCLLKKSYNFNIFPYVPRNFSIITENGTYKFNIDILKMKSKAIKQYLEEYPQSLQYNLNTKDELKIMQKIEQLFNGEKIHISNQEEKSFDQIAAMLRFDRLEGFDKMGVYQVLRLNSFNQDKIVDLSESDISFFVRFASLKHFIIATKNKEYECNIIGVHSSKVIHELILKNPNLTRYDFDFPDECSEFQLICDFFNFDKVQITQDNIDSLKMISEELQIEVVMDDINQFIDNYENLVQKVDDQQAIIDSNDELFEWLYNIKEITVQNVKDKILDSDWINTEENVQELVAFILQVIKNDILLHRYMADLIESLDKEANKSNKLEILVPFIVDKLMKLLGNSKFISLFIFILYQRGMIKKDEIMTKLKSVNSNVKKSLYNKSYVIFMPELAELFGDKIQFHESYINDFYKSCSSDNFQNFMKMREDGEPDDPITRALRNDDIDKFQSIISAQGIDINDAFIPYNIYDEFKEIKVNYINYSAAFGSIKCFKYLFLNHAKLNDSSFYYAIYGGNIEIIKIIDQQNMLPCSKMSEVILCAVKKHKDDLFDWIFEQKYNGNNIIQLEILIEASINGNIHSVASIIDKGFDFFDLNEDLCKSIFENASKNGFYKFLQFVFIFTKEVIEKKGFNKSLIYNPESSVYFGNISILKFYYEQCDRFDIIKAISIAINYEQEKIIEYICDHYDKELNSFLISILLPESLGLKTNKIFVYLINKFKNYISNSFTSIIPDLRNLLSQVCYSQNFEIAKIIIDIILEQNNNVAFDFALPFLNAALKGSTEICQFMIDKKCFINYEVLSLQKQELIHIKKDILCNIIQNMTPLAKKILINCYLIDAIKAKYIFLIEYLLKEDAKDDFSLIEAVKTQNIEIVNMILNKNSEASFVNKLSEDGTALNIAVSLNQLDIVKRLLSIPGIDPSLFGKNKQTPLVTSISKLNLDIFNAILDFYGTSINSQQFQLDEAVKQLLAMHLNTNGSLIKGLSNNSNYIEIFNRLMQIESINFNIYYNNYTFLSIACMCNEINIVKTLLKIGSIDINSCTIDDGNTPLINAIAKKNAEIAKLLIENDQININHRNYQNETALTKAVLNNLTEIVDIIINHKKFNLFESRLDYAFYLSIYKSNSEISKKLAELKVINVNYIQIYKSKWSSLNYKNQMIHFSAADVNDLLSTPLIQAANNSNDELFDLIINHQSFNPIKSFINEALYILITKNDFNNFRKLMKIANRNISIINKYMPTFLSYTVRNGFLDLTKEILNNEKFDSKRFDILNAFISSYNNGHYPYFDIMNEIIEFDKKHDNLIDFKHLLPNGKSFFTTLSNNIADYDKIVSVFIENGVDPNAPSKQGVYPLQYAISIKSKSFVEALIKSGKIDFSIKAASNSLSETNKITYLHMAANDVEILSLLLDKKLIDINVVDSNGETALMYACKSKNIKCINKLFEYDNLDYLHCGNDGDDAMKILLKMKSILNFDIPKNREEYHQDLLKIINNEIKPTKQVFKPMKISFGYQNENTMKIENKENEAYKPIKKFSFAKNFGEKNKDKKDDQTSKPSGIKIDLKNFKTPSKESKTEPSKVQEKNSKPLLSSFSKKANYSSEKSQINLIDKHINVKSNDNSSIQKEIVSSILELSDKFTLEEAQKISKKLESILNKEVEKITSNNAIIQHSVNEKHENKSENNPIFLDDNDKKDNKKDDNDIIDDKDKKDNKKDNKKDDDDIIDDKNNQENKLIRTRRKYLHHLIEEEIENYDDDYNLYQTQIIQQQWDQIMQINNMRNAQFSMMMNQQEHMMKSLVNGNKRNKTSMKKSKKKRKINK